MTYYTYDATAKTLVPAPRVITMHKGGRTWRVATPSAEGYAAVGAYPLASDDIPPVAPAGKVVVHDGYELAGGEWHARYRIEDAPPKPPRIFSKLKVVAALTKAGVWPQVKAWIEQAGLYDLYLAAQEFAEDNDYFDQGLTALKPVVCWTDEQVEALLAECVKD